MRPIGMTEMDLIFSVTDALGISREAIEVPLWPRDDGAVEKRADGKFVIVIPADKVLGDWLPVLQSRLEALLP